MRKILSVFLSFLFILSFSTSGYAATNNGISYEEFMSYVEAGYIPENISYSQWCSIIEKNNRLEKEMTNELLNSGNFELVYSSKNPRAYSSYTMQSGDIFITNSTTSFGLTGHAAIAINSSTILHIAGLGEVPSTLRFNDWLTEYSDAGGWTQVYRHTNSSVGLSAGIWALVNYKDSNVPYSFAGGLYDTTRTYCSKIVWQAYYYTEPVGTHVEIPSGLDVIIVPYDLRDIILNINQVHYHVN